MNKIDATVSFIVEDAAELSQSVEKFIKFAAHLAEELERGLSFSDEGYRGGGYMSLLEPLLNEGEGTPDKKIRNVDSVLELLGELLIGDYFLNTNLNYFSYVFLIYSRLLNYGEKDHTKMSRNIQKKGIELISSNKQKGAISPCKKTAINISNQVQASIVGFGSLYDLLRIICENPDTLYVGKDRELIHPKYQKLIKSIENLIEQYERWELGEYDINTRLGEQNPERLNDEEITLWYNALWEQPVEEMILSFCMYLLKKGELDILPEKEEIIKDMLELSENTSQERTPEIEAYLFNESPHAFYQKLYTYTSTLVDIVNHSSGKEAEQYLKMMLFFLKENTALLREKLPDDVDALEDVFDFFVLLIEEGYIQDTDIKSQLIQICLEYHDANNIRRSKQLRDFLKSGKK